MSGEAPPAEPPTKEMAEVRLDADGKPLSKNALKKLLKAEKAAKAKAEKAAKRVRLLRRSNICRAGCIIVHGEERRLLYFVIEVKRLSSFCLSYLSTHIDNSHHHAHANNNRPPRPPPGPRRPRLLRRRSLTPPPTRPTVRRPSLLCRRRGAIPTLTSSTSTTVSRTTMTFTVPRRTMVRL